MNREIKFRAWDTTTQKMINHNGGIIIISNNGVYIDSEKWKVMQFTGLKDKNGNEIYEGDILSIEGEYTEIVTDEGQGPTYSTIEFYEVIFENGAFCIKIKEKDGLFPYYSPYATLDHLLTDEISNKDIEICGNIYENPELLEQSDDI